MREKGKMTDANALAASTRGEGKRRSRILDPTTCSILAAIGMFGGLLSIAFGLFCAILDGIVANDTVFEQVSVALLMSGIPLMLIVGEKEQSENTVSVRKQGGEDLGAMAIEHFINYVETTIKEQTN